MKRKFSSLAKNTDKKKENTRVRFHRQINPYTEHPIFPY